MADPTVAELPPNVFNLTGLAFGRLIALRYCPGFRKNASWMCSCQCGRMKLVRADHLVQGRVRSCGCLMRQAASERATVHGEAKKHRHTREYKSWASMHARCKDRRARRYGARGISVCARWENFSAFLADMGRCPDGMTLDRIDCHGNYAPDNCRWATMFTQNRNRSSNRNVTYAGVTRCMTDWAHMVGMTRGALVSRLDRGWTIEKALTTPRRKQNPHSSSRSDPS
jgi:hypothetical protein